MPIESLNHYKNIVKNSSYDLLDIKEPGRNLHCHILTTLSTMRLQFLCDGIALKSLNSAFFSPVNLNAASFTASTPGISLLEYDAVAGEQNHFTLTFPFSWEISMLLKATNGTASSRWAYVSLTYETRAFKPALKPDIQQPLAVKDPRM